MKFKVTREKFLSGLGDTERAAMKRLQLADHYYFQGERIDSNERVVHKHSKENSKKYREVAQILSVTEFNIFSHLLEKESGPNELLIYTRSQRAENFSNLIAVHIMNMRKKLKKNDLPFFIQRFKTPFKSRLSYKLIEMKK